VTAAFLVAQPNGATLRALNYTPEVERLRAHRGTHAVRLGSLLSSMGPAYGAVFIRIDCAGGQGVELITQGDMFAAEPTGRIIRRDSMTRPERHEVKRWQVLISGAGTLGENELFGRAIIADARLDGRYVGPHAMVLTFIEPEADQSLFTYAFLLTRIGLRAIRATSYGTKILGLRKDLLQELPIPIAAADVRARVASLIRRSVAKRDAFLDELRSARKVIQNLPEMRQASDMCSERSRRALLWKGPLPTLCSWNFASTGDALAFLRRKWPGRLADVLTPNGVFNGPRFARVDCKAPHGIDFYSQRDAFLIRALPRRIARPEIPDRMLFVPRDAVLAGSHGQLTDGALFGKVELASFGAFRAGVTQDLLRLLFLAEQRATAFVYLSTLVGQRLLKSTAVGTSIPSMRLDLLGELPYPELAIKERSAVASHLCTAEQARIDSVTAESEAIRIVEDEVLPEWLA
jgi:hypothetical protein